MTDKEILDKVYQNLKTAKEIGGWKSPLIPPNAVEKQIEESINFIEQEWQKQDEPLGYFSNSWYTK